MIHWNHDKAIISCRHKRRYCYFIYKTENGKSWFPMFLWFEFSGNFTRRKSVFFRVLHQQHLKSLLYAVMFLYDPKNEEANYSRDCARIDGWPLMHSYCLFVYWRALNKQWVLASHMHNVLSLYLSRLWFHVQHEATAASDLSFRQ